MLKDDLIRLGYEKCDLHYTNGVNLVMEVLGRWYQTNVDASNIQIKTTQVEIKSVKDIQTPIISDPISVIVPNTPKKKKSGKQLLPSSIIRVSDKWYKNTENGKYMKPEWIESKYTIPK